MKNEKLIDEILDKILENGIESLSDEDKYILEHGEPSLTNKKLLNDDKEIIKYDNITFSVDKVFLLSFDNVGLKNISNIIDELFYVLEIEGTLEFKNEKLDTIFYITVDKLDKDKIEEGIEWDNEIFISNEDIKEHEKEMIDILLYIVNKYLPI